MSDRLRNTTKTALAIALALSGPFAASEAAGAATADTAKTSARTANKELATIVKQLNALETWFTEAEEQRAKWQQQIQEADTEVARLGLQVAELQSAVTKIEQRQQDLKLEAVKLEAERQSEGVKIAEHLNAAFRMSGQDFFKLLLNQENPEQFDRMIRYHQYFSTARGKILEGYRATLSAIATNTEAAATTEAKLRERRAATAAEQKSFSGQLSERKKMLAGLDRTTRNKTAERDRLQRDRQRLQALLGELAKRSELADGREFASRKGALPWPSAGTVASSYGQPRADGRLRWQGTYIETAAGAAVRAVHRGKVVFAEWLRGFGLLTIVDHGNGYMSLYGYADVLLKQPGDRVESGEQIANSGRSGGQNADGLYFEIRQAGKPVDPASWLQAQP